MGLAGKRPMAHFVGFDDRSRLSFCYGHSCEYMWFPSCSCLGAFGASPELHILLSICVDDFDVAGSEMCSDNGWQLFRT